VFVSQQALSHEAVFCFRLKMPTESSQMPSQPVSCDTKNTIAEPARRTTGGSMFPRAN